MKEGEEERIKKKRIKEGEEERIKERKKERIKE